MPAIIPSHITIDGELVPVPVSTHEARKPFESKHQKGWFDEDMGVFTIVLRDYWAAHGEVDNDTDLSDLLPAGFTRIEGARYQFDGDGQYGMDRLGKDFEPRSLTDKPMGRGWYYCVREFEGEVDPDDDEKSLIYISRQDSWGLEDAHLHWYFPEMPYDIGEVNESVFSSSWDARSTRAWMEANGFTHSRELQEMIDNEAW